MHSTPLIDTHVHLDDDAFDADRDEVIARALHAGVEAFIVPAVERWHWPRIADLCAARRSIFAAYGIHPLSVATHDAQDLPALESWLQDHAAVAIGEIGLDGFHAESDLDRQRVFFHAQLQIARRWALPVIVHGRRAFEEIVRTLRGMPGLRGVVHSFSGSPEQARQLWERGFYIGIGGPLTYPRAHRLRRLVAQMPLEYLLLESDAPDQPPVSRRGERNEPACVAEVIACVAELRGEPVETIAAACLDNARRLFGPALTADSPAFAAPSPRSKP